MILNIIMISNDESEIMLMETTKGCSYQIKKGVKV